MVEISPERLAELEKHKKMFLAKKKQTLEEKLAKIDTSTVGGRLRYQRVKKGLTFRELGELANLEVSVDFTSMELGRRKISFDKVLKFAEALEVKVEDIDPWTIAEIRRIDEKAQKTDSAGKQ